MATSSVVSVPTGQTGRQETLSEWAGPYVTDMLGKAKAISEMPYQTYRGPLTAGASPLQMQAFQGIGGLTVPGAIGQATDYAKAAADKAGGLSYSPTSFTNAFSAPGAYQPSSFTSDFGYQAATGPTQFTNTFMAPAASQATDFTNQFKGPGEFQAGSFASNFDFSGPSEATKFQNQFRGPGEYQAGTFGGGLFGLAQAQQYMNPFLQAALAPSLDEARRQAEMSRVQQAGRLSQAGAFGGARQAIMESELNRNLMQAQNKMIGEGYASAFDKAASLYGADMARAMEAQRLGEQSRQFGAGQAMTAAQLQAQYGMSAQQAEEAARQFNQSQALSAAQSRSQLGLEAQRLGEQSRQFGSQQGLTAAQLQAQYGLSAQQAQEAARQFNQGQAMTAAQLQAQYGMSAQQAQEASRQFNAGQALTAAQLQTQFGLDAQKASELSRQFGAQQAMTAAQLGAQYGTEAQRMAEQSKQFGAQYGLQGLAQQLEAARTMGALGQTMGAEQRANLAQMLGAGAMQRDIESEGIKADYEEFMRQRDYPLKMLQFQQSMLQGLPIQSIAAQYQQPTGLASTLNTMGGLMDLYERLFKTSPEKKS